MKLTITTLLMLSLNTPSAYAQESQMTVPSGWSLSDSGITKGENTLSVGPVLDLGELTPTQYLTKLADQPVEDMKITAVGELKNGDVVVQVLREITKKDVEARSTLFICKKGKNQHRLLELYTVDVFAVISGGKAAIGFCDQL